MNNPALQQLVEKLQANETPQITKQVVEKLLQNITAKTYAEIAQVLGPQDWELVESEPDDTRARGMIVAMLLAKSEKTLEEISEQNTIQLSQELLENYDQDRTTINKYLS